MRILAVGDSYLGVPVFEHGLARLAEQHELRFLQIDETRRLAPSTESERRLREYAGTPDQVLAHMDGVEALVVHGAPVSAEVIDGSPDLKLICCARGGPVNVDVAAATERGMPVVTTPGKNAEAVADLTLGFAIMLARRFPKAQRFLQRGGELGASTFEGAAFFGNELSGLSIGLIGYGQVGHAVARRTLSLHMRTLAFDPFVAIEDPGVEQIDELDLLLEQSDVVSLHARAAPGTDEMVDERFLARMRPGAYLVNTSRETLVVEPALDEALSSGRLGGAALDVVRHGSGESPHPLLRHDNVIITPHIGGATHETLLRGAAMIADAIEAFAADGHPSGVINGPEVELR